MAPEHLFHEPLWAFRKGERQIACELRYLDDSGVEARFLHDGVLLYSRRFATREEAVTWAESERVQHERESV